MPEEKTVDRARQDKRQGKAPGTQAGEFVREEMDRVKEGKAAVKSRKQAVAIGLSKARRAGVDLKPPKASKASAATRKKAERDYERGQDAPAKSRSTAKRSSAAKKAAGSRAKSASPRSRSK